jgi:hypothetical protein
MILVFLNMIDIEDRIAVQSLESNLIKTPHNLFYECMVILPFCNLYLSNVNYKEI